MLISYRLRQTWLIALVALTVLSFGSVKATDLNPESNFPLSFLKTSPGSKTLPETLMAVLRGIRPSRVRTLS